MLRTIVIVGAGFSGTTVATALLRRPPNGPTRLVLIERTAEIGRGVAYAARVHPFLLNVPASRMSASSTEPLEFLQFAQRRIPSATSEDFLPRALYGKYLQDRLLAARSSAPRSLTFEQWQGDVVGVEPTDRGSRLQVTLADGRQVTAHDVVLALGNPSPAPIAAAAEVLDHPAYVADPYRAELSLSREHRVLIIGTGSTAADMIAVAGSSPTGTPDVHILSRHGLVALRHTALRLDAFQRGGNAALLSSANSIRALTRSVRLLAHEAERRGSDWRVAIAFARESAPTIWQRLTEHERARFLRHARALWDVHRHRLPPQTIATMEALQSKERLHVHAGHIRHMRPSGGRIAVAWRPRGTDIERVSTFDRVVNCTGPDYSIARSRDPLWRSLLHSGLCIPDPLGLGVRTGLQGGLIDAHGGSHPNLFYIGPMLRADYWEATAAAELRAHAERLAAFLATDRR